MSYLNKPQKVSWKLGLISNNCTLRLSVKVRNNILVELSQNVPLAKNWENYIYHSSVRSSCQVVNCQDDLCLLWKVSVTVEKQKLWLWKKQRRLSIELCECVHKKYWTEHAHPGCTFGLTNLLRRWSHKFRFSDTGTQCGISRQHIHLNELLIRQHFFASLWSNFPSFGWCVFLRASCKTGQSDHKQRFCGLVQHKLGAGHSESIKQWDEWRWKFKDKSVLEDFPVF